MELHSPVLRIMSTALALLIGASFSLAAQAGPLTARKEHTGTCDASTGIGFGKNRAIVASDESGHVWFRMRADRRFAKPCRLRIGSICKLESEADVEGSARVGKRIYWIGSHGRNGRGQLKMDRHQLFVTSLDSDAGELRKVPGTRSYRRLILDLLSSEKYKKLRKRLESDLESLNFSKDGFAALDEQRRTKKDSQALNIEGLAASSGGQLLIGLRGPLTRQGEAILLPLLNPEQLINHKATRAEFGDPVFLNLGGLGIRSIEYWPEREQYIIAAGSWFGGREQRFALFLWSGIPAEQPARLRNVDLSGLYPEGVVLFPGNARACLLVSDDGASTFPGKKKPCKKLKKASKRRFRSQWVLVGKPHRAASSR